MVEFAQPNGKFAQRTLKFAQPNVKLAHRNAKNKLPTKRELVFYACASKNSVTCAGDLALALCKCANFSPFLKINNDGMPIT